MTGRVFNGTPHAINFFKKEDVVFCDKQRKYFLIDNNIKPYYTIEAGKSLLNCKKENEIELNINIKFPFALKGASKFVSVDPLPEGFDLYVISTMYRTAYLELLNLDSSKLATINDPVYTCWENPRPCGCLSLAVG